MAGEASKPRYVRCPKCRRLLMEITDVPVYKCGGCGTILQAKTRHANMEIGDRGGHADVPCENPPFSTSDNNSHEEESNNFSEEGRPSCRDNADMEAASTSNFRCSTGKAAVDTMSVASAPQSRLDGSCKLSKQGSVNSSSGCKIRGLTESVISEEEMFDGNPGNAQIRNSVTSITSSSHAYEGSVSSGDDISGKHERYRFLSRRTFRNRKPSDSSSVGTKDGKEDTLAGKNHTAPPNEMCDADTVDISGLERRSSSRNCAHSSEPDACSGSENPYSVQNELESDHLSSVSRSPSRDSTSLKEFPCNSLGGISSSRLGNLNSDRMEPPGRADLLRDKPTRPYAGGRRGDQRFPVGGSRHDGHRPPLFSDLGSEQVPTALFNGEMSQWQSTVSGRKTTAQRYQSAGIPISAEGNGSCLHQHSEGWRVPAHCRACSPHTCFHSSPAASSGFPEVDRDAALCHSSGSSDHHPGKLPGKEKRQHKKRRHCRPVSRGAPFVVCNKCSELLQLPVDFLVSRGRFHKLRCGACSEVLTFLYHGGHVVPHHASKHELSAHRSRDPLQEDPVSYSEENGPPPSQSYSTDGEPCTLRSSPEQKGRWRNKQRMGPPLHNLLGYASARDLLFVPGDEDEIYDSMDMSRFRKTPDGIDDEGYGGTGRSSLAQERSAVGYSPNQSEIQEEEEPVMRLAGARGGPSVRGFIRRDADELNHGLENMKLRPHRNGRPW